MQKKDAGLIHGWGGSPGEGNGTHSTFLPGKSHGQRNLAGYSPSGLKRGRHDLEATTTAHPLVSGHPSKTSQQWESPSVKFEVPVRPLKRYMAAILILQFIYTKAAINYIVVC